jgi:hypothetical protein
MFLCACGAPSDVKSAGTAPQTSHPGESRSGEHRLAQGMISNAVEACTKREVQEGDRPPGGAWGSLPTLEGALPGGRASPEKQSSLFKRIWYDLRRKNMAQRTAVSAGAIILREMAGELKIALAQHQNSSKTWVLPKGHVEAHLHRWSATGASRRSFYRGWLVLAAPGACPAALRTGADLFQRATGAPVRYLYKRIERTSGLIGSLIQSLSGRSLLSASGACQMHLRRNNAVTPSSYVEEMSRGPQCRLVGTHFHEQVEPQLAQG